MDKHVAEGWHYHMGTLSQGVFLLRLSDKDQNLLKFLARGVSQKEFEDFIQATISASTPEEAKEVLWGFKHKASHRAPFGHNFASFRFQAPVFVMRQIVKHEYLRLSELSMRYVRGMPEYFYPKEWRSLAEHIKQGSGEANPQQDIFNEFMDVCHEADSEMYTRFIDPNGDYKLPPEQARMFLRVSHMTEGMISGSLDAFANLCTLRLDGHAQVETRYFAEQIYDQLAERFPLSWEALMEGVKR